MDAAAGVSAIQAAGAIGAETSAYLERELPRVHLQLSASRRAPRGRSEADRVRGVRQIREIVAPVVEYVFARVEDTIDKLEVAFAAEVLTPMGDDVWSMGLMLLDRARRNLDMACDPFRKQPDRSKLVQRALWPDEWAHRYESLRDAIEDYSETIALGLDPKTRGEIEARLASVRTG